MDPTPLVAVVERPQEKVLNLIPLGQIDVVKELTDRTHELEVATLKRKCNNMEAARRSWARKRRAGYKEKEELEVLETRNSHLIDIAKRLEARVDRLQKLYLHYIRNRKDT